MLLYTMNESKKRYLKIMLSHCSISENDLEDVINDDVRDIQYIGPVHHPTPSKTKYIRQSWTIGSKCEIYSRSKRKWFAGVIQKIFVDHEGEWLEIQYGDGMCKQVQRWCRDVRELAPNIPSTIEELKDMCTLYHVSATDLDKFQHKMNEQHWEIGDIKKDVKEPKYSTLRDFFRNDLDHEGGEMIFRIVKGIIEGKAHNIRHNSFH
eukprot:660830_1